VTAQLTFAAPRRAKPPRHLADLDPAGRREAVAEAGEKPFRADQLSRHYFTRYTSDPAEMTDLPATSRDELAGTLLPTLIAPLRHLECDGGATRKTLWKLFDGALVESVLMRYDRRSVRGSERSGEREHDPAASVRNSERSGVGEHDPTAGKETSRVTLCVSSQAGCGMNCPFCATGQAGLTRNMSTAEIVDQVVAGFRMLDRGEIAGGASRVSNVVFMGMGEPLANYKAVIGAVRRMIDPAPAGLGMAQRGITVSTVGLVPAIDKLAAEDLQVTLALSLHAPDDELRDELVPVNTRWKVAEAIDAARRYFDRTGRRISIEYALICDINDQAWRADLLGRLLTERGRGWVHVNPIPLNPTPGSKWTASRPDVERAFVAALENHGIPVTVRDTRGRDIDGACGQLAAVDA
jgi:23S rRNA (adenine2503-C2)-methyltransferase